MNTKEKIYSAVVIALGLFYILGAISLLGLAFTGTDTKAVFIAVSGINTLIATILITTALLNLKAKQITPINTTIQIAFLFVSIYGIPIAIWGIFVLRASLGRHAGEATASSESHAG